ncbi:hypothetical protein K469DRAFT_613111, partial [Zopfia rhizophila CBS 207.26]
LCGASSLSTIFLFCRLSLRYRAARRFYSDDAFVFFAWVCGVASAIMVQVVMSDAYMFSDVKRRDQLAIPDFNAKSVRFLWIMSSAMLLFFIVLWSIKLSFLFFFRRLYGALHSWMRYWWVFLGVNVLCFCVCLGVFPWDCVSKSYREMGPKWSSSRCGRKENIAITVIGVCDVLTDVLITAIPFVMLWKVRISLRRKLGLGLVFSTTLLTITLTVMIRFERLQDSMLVDDIGCIFWGILLLSTAHIVSSLGSFRTLFVSQDDRQTPKLGDVPTIGSPQLARRGSFAHVAGMSALKSEADNEPLELESRRD